MKRTKLRDRVLPAYTRGEEIFNMVSHIVGGALGVATLALGVVIAALHHNAYAVVGAAIYGASMVILYTMSSIYHGLRPHLMAKRVFQVIDHCSIFLLIAGTYTPIALVALRAHSPALGWSVFGVVWAAAAVGILLNSIDLARYRVVSMICYLAMGWCILFAAPQTYYALGPGGCALLLCGGVLYTVGAVIYQRAKGRRYMHSVFHLFVVAGSVCHSLCILLFVL